MLTKHDLLKLRKIFREELEKIVGRLEKKLTVLEYKLDNIERTEKEIAEGTLEINRILLSKYKELDERISMIEEYLDLLFLN